MKKKRTAKMYALDALRFKARADRGQARASLELLLEHSVGIGDHSTGDFHDNLNEALDLLVDADDRIATLDEYYPE